VFKALEALVGWFTVTRARSPALSHKAQSTRSLEVSRQARSH
jgi:hypothetical protein